MAGSEPCDVSIGKFDILATYTYAKDLFQNNLINFVYYG
jgi:hypothetical protein